MGRRLRAALLAGLAVGLLAGLAEWLHLGLFVRGAGFQPVILLYALAIDGGLGLLVGLVIGLIWGIAAGQRPRQTATSPATVVRDMWEPRQQAR